jgi:hypothetical protein
MIVRQTCQEWSGDWRKWSRAGARVRAGIDAGAGLRMRLWQGLHATHECVPLDDRHCWWCTNGDVPTSVERCNR